ncbi:MAG: hypothetical protein EOO90_18405 [Pedobacter sp.]|nr:MAG: hypothetical protein EOO90_18405 [Pedobacter sp.]
MDNLEIINLWKKYDEKLEKTLSFNRRLIADLEQQKAKKALGPARNSKLFSVVMGLVYAALIGLVLVYVGPFMSIFFKASVGIHLLVTIVAIGMYVNQIVLIQQIDRSEDVISMQQKLASLQSSTIKVVAICFLQLPVFSTWNITFDMINQRPLNFWLIQMPIVALFTFAGVWLFKNINVKNIDKKWFKLMFNGTEWKAMRKSARFLKEIEQF